MTQRVCKAKQTNKITPISTNLFALYLPFCKKNFCKRILDGSTEVQRELQQRFSSKAREKGCCGLFELCKAKFYFRKAKYIFNVYIP